MPQFVNYFQTVPEEVCTHMWTCIEKNKSDRMLTIGNFRWRVYVFILLFSQFSSLNLKEKSENLRILKSCIIKNHPTFEII